ncbi:MAG: TIGR00730 family Rossman fold protein [Pseudomonadota bacterium]|nr:TIGR00730 family Rossman fold protein [Pseudomonadota bacterium]
MNRTVKNICVYCGSGPGLRPAFAECARSLGRDMAKAGIGLVYGGGGRGLMGEIARSVIANGGHVTGVIPDFLVHTEHAMRDLDNLVVTASMHERKRQMFERSDAFIALPGGIGTLEELVEQLTWAQLGQHTKPIILADIEGFWQPLLKLLAHMQELAFIRPGLEVRLNAVSDVSELLPRTIELAEEMAATAAEDVVSSKF